MNPIVTKLPLSLPDQINSEATPQPAKAGVSQFDQIRDRLTKNTGVDSVASGSHGTPDNQSGISRAKDGITADTPSSRVQNGLAVVKHHLGRLRKQVGTMAGAISKPGMESRLVSVEQQYAQIDSAAKALPPNASPQQWIALQQQVYSMNENITALSKLVGQSASGVKTILQTQV